MKIIIFMGAIFFSIIWLRNFLMDLIRYKATNRGIKSTSTILILLVACILWGFYYSMIN